MRGLNSTEVALLQCWFALSYVGSLYVVRAGRLAFGSEPRDASGKKPRSRDHPDVIRTRLIAVSLAALSSCFSVFAARWWIAGLEMKHFSAAYSETISALGMTWSLPNVTSLLPYLLVPLLYTGPLYVHSIESALPLQRRWSFQEDMLSIFTTLQGLRNYIIAPITEELVFRASIIAVANLGETPPSAARTVFLTPLWFGVAHLHHAWEVYNNYGGTGQAVKQALAISLFQLLYTSVFGWFTAFVFIRTHSIYPAIFAHIFCNIMGLPMPVYAVRIRPAHKTRIWAAHFLGMIGFAFALGPWTDQTRQSRGFSATKS